MNEEARHAAAVRAQLERILASDCFARSDRLSSFLRFVVEETLQGRGATLKEPVLAHELYGREVDFDGANPIVRVDARRLRDKLREYYADRADDAVSISLPKGSYAPVFEVKPPPIPMTASEGASWRTPAAALLVVLLLGGVGYALYSRRADVPKPSAGRTMLVVLPFQNLTGDAEQEYLSDGLTEETIAVLGSVAPLRLGVIARTSAMHYKNTMKRAGEIGRELGAGYLLETSLRRVGDRARITAQLIDVQTESQIWVEQYEGDAGNALALQVAVASTVAERTLASLGVAPTPNRTARHSLVPAAYEHYLRGRYQLARDSADSLRKAEQHFGAAIELDRSYARAYSGLAETYALLGSYDVVPIGESHPLGRGLATEALRLDDSLAEAHRALAAIVADHYWDWAEAERHYSRAMALEANDVTTLRFYSFYLAYTGRAIDAIPIAERARRLDPASPGIQLNLGVVLSLAGRLDDGIRQFEETIDLDPSHGFAHAMLGLAYYQKGLPERALAELETARRLEPSRPDVVSLHGHLLGRSGHTREALATIDRLRQLAGGREPSPFLIASVYVGLADADRAFDWLEKAFAARSWELPLLKTSPLFSRLRPDPRFASLVERLGLPERGRRP